MPISFGSINTGLPKNIVQQIIAAEKIPVEKMRANKQKLAQKENLVGELIKLTEEVRSFLFENTNERSFREFESSFRDDLIGVAIDKNLAAIGNHRFEVISLAQKSSAISSGFANPNDVYLGVGHIEYELPNGESREVYIDPDHSSLNGVAKLINNDKSNGLKATVVNDGAGGPTPWRLILSLEKSGDEYTAKFPYFYFIDGDQDFYIESQREASDAVVKLDGFKIELPNNKAKNVIPGLTIDLKKAAPREEFTIELTENVTAIGDKVKDLVEKINNLLLFIRNQSNIDRNTDTSTTLGGELLLQTIESRLRNVIFTPVKTQYGMKRFGTLGISFNRSGSLVFDKSKFEAMTSKDYPVVAQILFGHLNEEREKVEGFFDKLGTTIENSLRSPDGVLKLRKSGLQNKIRQVDKRIVERERIIRQKEQNLKNKFARLESTISRIRNSAAGISSLGNAQPPPIQQLG